MCCFLQSNHKQFLIMVFTFKATSILIIPAIYFIQMEIISAFGGLSLVSPTLAKLQCMPMPTLDDPSVLCIRKNKPYIGGSCDIFPPLSKGGEHILWYMGNKYFRVSSHVSNPNNHRLEFWSRSYSTYRLLYGQITLMEVIECLVDSRNGDPTFVGRLFISLDESSLLHQVFQISFIQME
jgi:hypothetical protein